MSCRKMVKRSVKIPLYGGYFTILCGSKEEWKEWRGCNYPMDEGYEAYMDRFNVSGKGHVVVAFAKGYETPGLIAHECAHAAGWILDHVGVKPDWKNDEAFTYLLSWMVNRVYESIKMKMK